MQVYLRELQEEAGLTDAALRHIALVAGTRCVACAALPSSCTRGVHAVPNISTGGIFHKRGGPFLWLSLSSLGLSILFMAREFMARAACN